MITKRNLFRSQGRLPIQVEGIYREIKTFERLTAEVAVKKDRDIALMVLMVNPQLQDVDQAKIILDEMKEAHKKYLNGF